MAKSEAKRSTMNPYSDPTSKKRNVGTGDKVFGQLKPAPATSEGYRNSHGGKPAKKVK